MTRRHLLAAGLLASLALHACLFLWLASRPPYTPPEGPSAPLEVDILVEADPAPPASPPQVAQPARPVVPVPKRPRPAEAPARPGPTRAEAPAAPSSPPPSSPPASSPPVRAETGGPTGGPSAEDAAPKGPRRTPEALALVPRSDFVVPGVDGLSAGAAPPARPGHSSRPGDAEGDRDARLAREGLEARARVQEWASDAFAEQRVRDGRLHPYYGELRKALEEKLRTPPQGLTLPKLAPNLVSKYLADASAYGKGPGSDPPGADERLAAASRALEREMAARSGRQSGPASAPRPKGADTLDNTVLRVVVELRQTPDGAFAGQELLRSSGNPLFDAFALERAPLAVAGLTLPPPPGKPEGLRTMWSIEGRVSYRRKVRDFKLPQDAPYLAALLGTGALGGSFDLTNLEDTEVPDIRNPHWVLKPELLRAY